MEFYCLTDAFFLRQQKQITFKKENGASDSFA